MAQRKQKRARLRALRPVPAAAEEEDGKDSVTQLAVRIPSRLYRKVKIHSIATGASMSQITEDAYRALLQQRRAG